MMKTYMLNQNGIHFIKIYTNKTANVMKKTYSLLTIALLIATFGTKGQAQSKDTQEADKRYARMEYVAASKAYLDLIAKGKKDIYIYKQLADSYYNVFNASEAIKWYEKVTAQPQDAETYYKYAQMLKANGNYELANKQMAIFAQKLPADQRAVTFNQNPNYIPQLQSKQKLFDVKTTSINSDKSDFGAVLANDDVLYFTSARNVARKKTATTEEPYLDIYKSIYTPNNSLLSAPSICEDLNTPWHDGPVSVSTDGLTMFFARDSRSESIFEKDKKANSKVSQVHLFRATRANAEATKWDNIKPLPINGKAFSTSNPSLSADGRVLYFNSNMPGGLGGNDIWRVAVNADNTYGKPENLGKGVNTEGNEQFPFIANDGVLYFSSSARQGFGGLDVFFIDTNSNDAVAKNVGKPVNTQKDDFAFTLNAKRNIAFFSSNRDGNDDIFMAIPVCGVEALVTVSDVKTGKSLPGARVAILDDKKNIIETRDADSNGVVSYNVDCDKNYSLQVAMDGYESASFELLTKRGGKQSIAATLNPIDVIVTPTEVVLKPINFEYNKSNITQDGAFELDKLVLVMKNNASMVIMVKSHTDNRGSDLYNLELSEKRANATVQYIVSKGIDMNRISGKGFGETEPKIDCKENCSEVDFATNRRSEFLIVK
jgi:outer membrane protein OmpA-like peptidoglycan-associated protein/tetratricopeptide (TPR) repeat protein